MIFVSKRETNADHFKLYYLLPLLINALPTHSTRSTTQHKISHNFRHRHLSQMQETHSMGGGGRFFGGGDRRLRPHHHHHNQALNCPRCDSLNTKFCYYNNYNLSQPRHFCKNCRRYWTQGGVLRNIPIGGGCRKSKRSNHNNNNSSETETTALPEHNSNSHSSSESSSLTATTEAVSEPNTFNSDSNSNNESKLLIPSSNPALETGALKQQGTGDCTIFSEIGSFTCFITSNNDTLQFGFDGTAISDTSSFHWHHHKALTMNMTLTGDDMELKFPKNLNGCDASLLDHGTVPVDLSRRQNRTGHEGFGSLDLHGDGDQGLFDLSDTVDHTYWTPHWSDHDNSTLFHLP